MDPDKKARGDSQKLVLKLVKPTIEMCGVYTVYGNNTNTPEEALKIGGSVTVKCEPNFALSRDARRTECGLDSLETRVALQRRR